MDLEKLAAALGLDKDLDSYKMAYYGEHSLTKKQMEKYARERLEEAILARISELVEKLWEMSK